MGEYRRVLIVDDELIARQGIKHMMVWEKEGFQIVGEASNGKEGLEMIEALHPDIVLADIVMPVLNGIDFSFIMKEKYPDIQLIMLSSYDDFEYVKTSLLNGAIDYVLKPTLNPEILLEALVKASGHLSGNRRDMPTGVSMHRQMERYLAGFQDTLDAALFQERFPYMQYRILGVDLKSACGGNRQQMNQLKEWSKSFFKSDKHYAGIGVLVEEEVLCYLFNFRNKDEALLLSDIQNCVEKCTMIAEKILFVLSKTFSEFDKLKQHYQEEICPGLKQAFYFPNKHLINSCEVGVQGSAKRFAYERFTEEMAHKQYDGALKRLRDYMDYLTEIRYDEYLTKNLCKNLLYNFVMSLENSGISGERLKREYFERIDQAAYVDDFSACCAAIYDEFQMIARNSGSNEDERMKEIKAYIRAHYGEKLDLKEIAHVFNYNYHYISSYFNQHMQEGFSGYLNKIRIEKACELLKERKIPISGISGEVGYADHGYFCRVFKKATGMTPSQYRRSMKE